MSCDSVRLHKYSRVGRKLQEWRSRRGNKILGSLNSLTPKRINIQSIVAGFGWFSQCSCPSNEGEGCKCVCFPSHREEARNVKHKKKLFNETEYRSARQMPVSLLDRAARKEKDRVKVNRLCWRRYESKVDLASYDHQEWIRRVWWYMLEVFCLYRRLISCRVRK